MKSSRTIREAFTRIAVCTAVLVTSLLSQSLHNLQHRLEDAAAGRSDASQDLSPSCSCAFHRHCESSDSHKHDGSDDSTPSHDSHNCAICYVLGLSATTPVVVGLEQTSEVCFERLIELSEFASSEFIAETYARGPPIA